MSCSARASQALALLALFLALRFIALRMSAGSSRTRSPVASLRVSPHWIRIAFSLSSSVPALSSWRRSRFFSASAKSRSRLFFFPPDLASDLLSRYVAFLESPAIPPKSTPAKSSSRDVDFVPLPVLTTVPPNSASDTLCFLASLLPTRVDPPLSARFFAASTRRCFSARRAARFDTASGDCTPPGRCDCRSAILARSLARRASMRVPPSPWASPPPSSFPSALVSLSADLLVSVFFG